MATKKGKKKEEEEQSSEIVPTLESQFEAFAKFNDLDADGKTITLSKSDVWLKQAKVLDMKTVTTTDTGICWIQYKKRTLDIKHYMTFLQDLAEKKGMDLEKTIESMIQCGMPGEKQKKEREQEDKRLKVEQTLFGEKT